MLRVIVLFLLLVAVTEAQRQLELPETGNDCVKRTDLATTFRKGHYYYFSWTQASTRNQKRDWLDARNICRKHCQDLVSIETQDESKFVIDAIREGNIDSIWTSGRKCNFGGCEKPDLQPAIVNGWFWSGSGARMRPPHSGGRWSGEWSTTGANGQRQPDKRERGSDEACLGILNNAYQDGIKWHDVACGHTKAWICEDSEELLAYARRKFRDVNIP